MAASRGLRLLHASRRVELKRLMRVNDGEQEFTAYLNQMRDIARAQPVSPKLLDGLRPVSAVDLNDDPEWRFAPVGAISHIERDVINVHQLVRRHLMGSCFSQWCSASWICFFR